MAVNNYPTKVGKGNTVYWRSGCYPQGWSYAYNLASSYNASYESNNGPGWCVRDDGCALIHRAGLCFDTREFPAGAVISSAKIKLSIKFTSLAGGCGGSDDCPYPVMDALKLYRAPSLDFESSAAAKSDYGYLGGCGIYLGGLLVTPGMVDEVDCEIPLNAAGIASIISGDYTKFGMKADSDTPSSPSLGTHWGTYFNNDTILLEITYEAAGALKVVTIAATDVTKNSLTVNGQITQGTATKRGFDWGLSAVALINEWYEEGTFGVEEFSHAVTGLTPGQDFCHRAKAME